MTHTVAVSRYVVRELHLEGRGMVRKKKRERGFEISHEKKVGEAEHSETRMHVPLFRAGRKFCLLRPYLESLAGPSRSKEARLPPKSSRFQASWDAT